MSLQRIGISPKKVFVSVAILIASAALFSVGCTVATHDSTTDRGPLKLTLPAVACLNQAIPVIQNYFQGRANEADVNTSWSCVSGALGAFAMGTKGASADSYTARELRTFLETFYLSNVKISYALLTEIMRVKQILFGGTEDRLTRIELAQIQSTLQILRAESLRLLPYIRYLFLTASVDEAFKDRTKVEAGISAMQTSVANLAPLFGRSPTAYAVEDFATLISELQPIFKTWSGLSVILNYVPTLQIAKALLLNPPGNRIAPSEWQALLLSAAKFYGLYLRAHYLIGSASLTSGVGLQQTTAAFNDIASLLKTAVEAKSSKVIPFTQLDAVVDEAIRLDLVPATYRDSTIKALIRTAMTKWLNPSLGGARSKVTGLNTNGLENLRGLGASFLDMQRAYDDVVLKAVSTDPTLTGKPLPWKTFVTLWSQQVTQFPNAQEDLRRLITLPAPVSFRENGTVIFDNRLTTLTVSPAAFVRYNWLSAAIRLAVSGYSTDADANRWTGLTQDQVKALYSDLHDIGTDMMILEPDDDVFWQSAYSESNMFMPSALNDDHLSDFEAFDYAAILLSGTVMAGRLFDDVKQNCARVGVDVFQRPLIEISCFRTRYGQLFSSVHAELPWWVSTQKSAGPSGWPAFEQALEAAARTTGVTAQPISAADITHMTVVMEYIESLFVRFDLNRDGVFDHIEAEKALPLFKALLATASGFSDAKKIDALYMYIMKYGAPPKSLSDKLYFQFVWLGRNYDDVTADRLKLLNVIAALKSAAKPAPH